tara:strand:+ start:224 stop:472 length:249 start_codon:yes stop_codon:yes gene_type:complete
VVERIIRRLIRAAMVPLMKRVEEMDSKATRRHSPRCKLHMEEEERDREKKMWCVIEIKKKKAMLKNFENCDGVPRILWITIK